MRGEMAIINIHLFPNGMYVECEDIDDAKFIPEGDIQPLIDFINKELWAYEILHFHGIDIYGNGAKGK